MSLLRNLGLPGVLALVALSVSAASLVVIFSDRPPANDSAEAGFARDMIVHHAQAVEMAEIVRDRTEDQQIENLATDIVLTQQGQIGQMQGWLSVWGLSQGRPGPAMEWMGHPTRGPMPGMASAEEINVLREAPPEETDEQFLRLMIPHHQAAVPMAEAVIEQTDDEEVARFAETVDESQTIEIELMQQMLRDRDLPEVEGEVTMDHDEHDHEDHH
jgi:uncharacterized protein (DUF305 family)